MGKMVSSLNLRRTAIAVLVPIILVVMICVARAWLSDMMIDNATNAPAPPPAGVVCDYGPNWAGTYPSASVTTAVTSSGFTTCALNADFTTNYFPNAVSSWLIGCGAADVNWRFKLELPYGGAVTCRADLEVDATDGGKQVLHLQQQPGDVSTDYNGVRSLNFPGWTYAANRNTTLPKFMYVEFKVKALPVFGSGFSCCGAPGDFWQNGNSTADNGLAIGPEHDYLEYGSGNPNYGTGYHFWIGGTSVFGSSQAITIDLSAYHIISVLMTSDKTTDSFCPWVDGVGTGCIHISPPAHCPTWYPSDPAGCDTAAWENHQAIQAMWFGTGPTHIGQNVDLYFEYIRIITCAGYRTASVYCTGPSVITQ